MKIVVAIDQSDCSSAALQSMLCMNFCCDDEARIVTVIDPFADAINRESEEDRCEGLIEKALKTIRSTHADMKVTGEVLLGSPRERLLELCESWGADLIVVGAHGKPEGTKLMLGKISNSLLDQAVCSVKVIKDHDISSGAQFRNVLIPVDRTESSERAIKCVLDTRFPDYVTFHIVSVIPVVNSSESLNDASHEFLESRSKEFSDLHNDHEEMVRSYAERLNAKFGMDRASYEVLHGSVRDEILRLADNLPAGLIVVGSHGKDFLQKFLLGSVSQTIALQSTCSVEVVKTGEGQKEAA